MDYRVRIGVSLGSAWLVLTNNKQLQHLKSVSQTGKRDRENMATEVKGDSIVMGINRIECSGKRQFNDTKWSKLENIQ